MNGLLHGVAPAVTDHFGHSEGNRPPPDLLSYIFLDPTSNIISSAITTNRKGFKIFFRVSAAHYLLAEFAAHNALRNCGSNQIEFLDTTGY